MTTEAKEEIDRIRQDCSAKVNRAQAALFKMEMEKESLRTEANELREELQQFQDLIRRSAEWFGGDDTGASSITMLCVALGAPPTGWRCSAPLDSGDFGRCKRLLDAIPEVREAFPRIAQVVPEFRGTLDNWDELVARYIDAEDAPRRADRWEALDERLERLRGGARR